jgi:methylmalonyl-CoA mutase N-terminal domain/subunit
VEQNAALACVKQQRSSDDARRTLDALRHAAEAGRNVMPELLDTARARVTVGEAMTALAEVFGRCDTAVV